MNSTDTRLRFVPSRRWLLIGMLALALLALLIARWEAIFPSDITLARQALERREFDDAITALSHAERMRPASAQVQYLLAVAHRRSRHVEMAAKHLSAAERLGWNADDIRRQRLLLDAQAGKIKEVEGQLAELLQQGADDSVAEEIYEGMASSYLSSYYLADANKCLQFWIQWQPDNPLPHQWLGDVLIYRSNPEQAAEEFAQALTLNPNDHETRKKLAQAQLDYLDLSDAAQTFEQCLTTMPADPEPLLGLAECRRRQGREKEAIALLHDALSFELPAAKTAQALNALGRLSLEAQQYHRALHLLENSIALDPTEPTSRLGRASVLVGLGRDAEAAAERETAGQIVDRRRRLVALTQQVAKEPDNAELRFQTGLVLWEQGLYAVAADWFNTAIQIDPRHPGARQKLDEYVQRRKGEPSGGVPDVSDQPAVELKSGNTLQAES
jgi:tetratricopeptide (TPR) repeat protein